MTRFVLLASPLLGPATWAPVAEELTKRRHRVTVPRLDRAPARPSDIVAGFLAQLSDEPGLVLVPHSNAGLYVAALAVERRVSAVVFVDALLPADQPTTATTSQGLRAFLGGLADTDGLLPPWTSWWPESDVAGLFPDARTRLAVEREQPRLPLGYFDDRVPSPTGWLSLPAAYLAFGDSYADERAIATARDWPVETLPGRHLHQLVDPVAVANAVLRLGAAARTSSAAPTPAMGAEQDEPGGTSDRGACRRPGRSAD